MPARGRGPSTIYHGESGGVGPRKVRVNGKILDPKASLLLRRHSPDGFSWGYAGSGPSQLALALLLDYTGSRDLALTLYHRFKDAVVATWKSDEGWWLTGAEMDSVIEAMASMVAANAEGDDAGG